ncbi:hypothetical protein [Jiangella alkaliphila]|uniref:Terminase n=1 Tax=Jiangella alkaliphila TaxID=419479 RepID=A0A1H2IEB9_9ACTN|nr:hypothetical protein [Jiangella alkaliphila]SDU42467.1 hypothetical protein SAMN04488563_1650 [Jiangella alkaliphila]
MPAPTDSPPSAKHGRRRGPSPLRGRQQCADRSCRRLARPGELYCPDHPQLILDPATRLRGSKRLGRTEPRLYTPPLRPLTRETTRGFEVIEFAELIGEPLLPWQQWLVKHALELNEDGTYRFRTVLVLVARQNGKSSLKRIVSLWRLYMDSARLVLGVAQDVSLAREQWNYCQDTIHASPDLEAEFDVARNVNGDEWFRLTKSAGGGRYKIAASNRKAGRGLSIDELNIDELREQRNWAAWSALSKTTMARAYSQIWAMSNAGDDESVVLNQLREAALAGRDPSLGLSLGLFEWSGPDGCELDDWDALAQANPALGYTISEGAIFAALGTDPPDVFRTEVLCQKVDQLDGAIDLARWNANADPSGGMPTDGLVACFEVDEDGQHATLGVAAHLGDGRVRGAIRKSWPSAAAARAELADVLDDLAPTAVAWFPSGPSAEFAPILRPAGMIKMKGRHLHRGREYVELTGLKVSEACMGLAGLTKAGQLIHPADPLLDAHITGSKKLPTGDGWRFVRRGAGHVSAAYAMAGAAHVALTLPPIARPNIRMAS